MTVTGDCSGSTNLTSVFVMLTHIVMALKTLINGLYNSSKSGYICDEINP